MGKAFIGNFMGPTGPQGPQGPPGEIAAMPSIGSNGNWFIGERDTGVLADVDRALSAKIVASTEISEPGFIMDGKTASEKFAELNSNYIIEEGSNDNGHWRKWSNGTLDMWGIYSFSSATINQAVGAIYYSNAYLITLPFPSLSRVTGISYSVISSGSCWATGASNGDHINNLGWRLESGIQYSASGGLSWRCTGTWK